MSDPIDCTECWTGDDCELHPSAPVTDDSTDVGPAIKDYTIQEKRHEKELTKFKTARDALEKRCELQLETIRDLRLQLDLVTEDRQVEIETRQRLTVDNDALRRDLYSVINERDQAWGKIVELQADLDHATEHSDLNQEKLEKAESDVEDLQSDLHSVISKRDELKAELSKQRNIGSDWEREAFKLRRVVDGMGADLDHAVEVKNRCVASVNRLCSQVVELQAQLKGKE